jgi:glutathione S-transferase
VSSGTGFGPGPFERRDIDLTNKPHWFLKVSPLGKTPVLRVDGHAHFESAVICEYLNETALMARAAEIHGRPAQIEAALGQGPHFDGTAFSLVDAVFGPVFRYCDAFDAIGEFGFWQGLAKAQRWRRVRAQKPAVAQAVRPDDHALLHANLLARRSALSRRMTSQGALA